LADKKRKNEGGEETRRKKSHLPVFLENDATLVNNVRTLKTKVQSLEEDNKTLKTKVQTLEKDNKTLKSAVENLLEDQRANDTLIMLGEVVQSIESHLTHLFVKQGKNTKRQPYNSILNGGMLDGAKKKVLEETLQNVGLEVNDLKNHLKIIATKRAGVPHFTTKKRDKFNQMNINDLKKMVHDLDLNQGEKTAAEALFRCVFGLQKKSKKPLFYNL